jgi:hypothetical protein
VRLAQGVRGALVGLEAESREGGDEAGQVELLEALGEGLEWALGGSLLPAGEALAETGPGVELEAIAQALEAGDLDEVVARATRELAANPVAMLPNLLLAGARLAMGQVQGAQEVLEAAQARWPSRLAGLMRALCVLTEGEVAEAIRVAAEANYACMMLCPHGFSSLPCVTDAEEDAFIHAVVQALGDEVLVQVGVSGALGEGRRMLLDALLRVQPWEAFEALHGLSRWGHALELGERALAHGVLARLARYFGDWAMHDAELEVARGLGLETAWLEREAAGVARDQGFARAGLVEIVGFGDRFSIARTVDHDIVSGVTFAERFPSAERAAERMVRTLGHLADAGYTITVLDEALQAPWDAARAAAEEELEAVRAWEAEAGWTLERVEAIEAALEEGDHAALSAALEGLDMAEDAAAPVIAAWAAVLRSDWRAAREALLTRGHLWAARCVEAVAELADEEDPTDFLVEALGAQALWTHTLIGDAPVEASLLPAPGPLAAMALGAVMEAAADAALDLLEEIGWMDARGAVIQALSAPSVDAALELCAEYLADGDALEPAARAALLLAQAHWLREAKMAHAEARERLKEADRLRPASGWPALQAELEALAMEEALLARPQLTLALEGTQVALELDEDGRRHERWGVDGVDLTRTAEPSTASPGEALVRVVRELRGRGMR